MSNETCANCGHEEEYHYKKDKGCNIGIRRNVDMKNEYSYPCPCKKFVPQNQSPSRSEEVKTLDGGNTQSHKEDCGCFECSADVNVLEIKKAMKGCGKRFRKRPTGLLWTGKEGNKWKWIDNYLCPECQNHTSSTPSGDVSLVRTNKDLRGIFDVSDLDFSIKENATKEDEEALLVLQGVRLERQRIKAEVEKVLDETYEVIEQEYVHPVRFQYYKEELKKRLGIK